MAKVLNQCPICGSRLEYHALHQYSKIYTVKKNGDLSERCRKEDIGSMECGYLVCSACDFVTDCELHCDSHPHIRIWQQGYQYYYEEDE